MYCTNRTPFWRSTLIGVNRAAQLETFCVFLMTFTTIVKKPLRVKKHRRSLSTCNVRSQSLWSHAPRAPVAATVTHVGREADVRARVEHSPIVGLASDAAEGRGMALMELQQAATDAIVRALVASGLAADDVQRLADMAGEVVVDDPGPATDSMSIRPRPPPNRASITTALSFAFGTELGTAFGRRLQVECLTVAKAASLSRTRLHRRESAENDDCDEDCLCLPCTSPHDSPESAYRDRRGDRPGRRGRPVAPGQTPPTSDRDARSQGRGGRGVGLRSNERLTCHAGIIAQRHES